MMNSLRNWMDVEIRRLGALNASVKKKEDFFISIEWPELISLSNRHTLLNLPDKKNKH